MAGESRAVAELMFPCLFSRRALSGKDDRFGLGTCIGLLMPHARKTWPRSYMTEILLMRMRFSIRIKGKLLGTI